MNVANNKFYLNSSRQRTWLHRAQIVGQREFYTSPLRERITGQWSVVVRKVLLFHFCTMMCGTM